MIRPATPADAVAIAALFHRTVRQVNARDYTRAQVAAWAGPAPDPENWLGRQATRLTLVNEHAGILRGFAELQPEGSSTPSMSVPITNARESVPRCCTGSRRRPSRAASVG